MNHCNDKPMEHGFKQKCSSPVSTGENTILLLKVNKTFCLKMLYMQIMHFDQTQPLLLPSNLSPVPTTLPFPSPFFYAYVCGCRTIYWSMGSLSGPTSLKKTVSPSPSSHQLPTARQESDFMSPSATHARILVGVILDRSCAHSHRQCALGIKIRT